MGQQLLAVLPVPGHDDSVDVVLFFENEPGPLAVVSRRPGGLGVVIVDLSNKVPVHPYFSSFLLLSQRQDQDSVVGLIRREEHGILDQPQHLREREVVELFDTLPLFSAQPHAFLQQIWNEINNNDSLICLSNYESKIEYVVCDNKRAQDRPFLKKAHVVNVTVVGRR